MPASIRPAARGDLPAGEVRAIEARPDDYEEWVEWDAAIGGRLAVLRSSTL